MRKSILACILGVFLISLITVSVAEGKWWWTTVTVDFCEDATRFYPDGSVWTSWINDPYDEIEFQKGFLIYTRDEMWYNYPLADYVSGKMMITNGLPFSVKTSYTSPASGLPIKEELGGTVWINDDRNSMSGGYVQKAFAIGSESEVKTYYPNAESACKQGWGSPKPCNRWFIGFTVYTVHPCGFIITSIEDATLGAPSELVESGHAW